MIPIANPDAMEVSIAGDKVTYVMVGCPVDLGRDASESEGTQNTANSGGIS